MAIIFCDIQGIVLKHLVPYWGLLFTSSSYSVTASYSWKAPWTISVRVHVTPRQRARTHQSCSGVQETTRALGIELLPHPPYIPDSAICDFWLFPNMKDVLRGKKYESREELEVPITTTLRGMSRDGLEHVFCSWTERWQKCISSRGKYFEKL